jgi:PIN domain nuclease of toxin-antitoxin system
MTTVLLDSHVVQWWSAEPDRLSEQATRVLDGADELAIASISWFELGMAGPPRAHHRVHPDPLLARAAGAAVANRRHDPGDRRRATLPKSFPGDPADRLIYATAVEHGWPLVTKAPRLSQHRLPRPVAVW